MLTLHLVAVAFWYGVVGAEFIIERSRAHSKPHGFEVARNHFWIDLTLEMPVVAVVLVTGIALYDPGQFSGLYMLKIVAGLIAVGSNIVCVIPVVLRKIAADKAQLHDVIRHSRTIDKISAVGVPAAFIALALGILLTP